MTKSANMRVALLPYPVSYIAALSMRTSYDANGFPHFQVDEDLRKRLETKLIVSILGFDLN